MSRYQFLLLAVLPATLVAVTVMWWLEADTNKEITWREMWSNMWEAS